MELNSLDDQQNQLFHFRGLCQPSRLQIWWHQRFDRQLLAVGLPQLLAALAPSLASQVASSFATDQVASSSVDLAASLAANLAGPSNIERVAS